MSQNTYERVLADVMNIQIVDTHEHLPGSERKREQPTDPLREYLSHYMSSDLISAGLPPADLSAARDTSKPLSERWQMVAPYWEACRHTGYGRALDLAVQDLYGIPRIDGETLDELNGAFQKALSSGNHFDYVLKEKSRIRVSLLDSDLSCDHRFFRSVFRLDEFLFPTHIGALKRIERRVGTKIHSLGDWKAAAEQEMDQALSQGAVALKCGLAYRRALRFNKVSEAQADAEFTTLFADAHLADPHPGRYLGDAFQDHMMHHILSLADSRGLTVQFHTGLQEGNGNFIYDSDPALLTNLFVEYRDVKFDIFHIGYPYQQTLSALAKNFPNVYIDMCWAHIISPEASIRALDEWIDSVPMNKISAFGGDYCFVDGVYGHQLLARQNIAKVLAGKVDAGIFDLDRAAELARWLFVDNPVRLFHLDLS